MKMTQEEDKLDEVSTKIMGAYSKLVQVGHLPDRVLNYLKIEIKNIVKAVYGE